MSDFAAASFYNTVQRIELFCSFFDRLFSSSPNYHQHLKSLTQFKSILYSNIHNPQNINSQLQAFLSSEAFTSEFSSFKTISHLPLHQNPSSIYSLDSQDGNLKSLKIEPKPQDNYLVNITSTDITSNYHHLDKTTQARSLVPESYEPIKELNTIFEFLSFVKASEHSEINSLFLLAGDYSHARAFKNSNQSTFLALSYSFYEVVLSKNRIQPDVKAWAHRFLSEQLQKIGQQNFTTYNSFLHQLKFLIDSEDKMSETSLTHLISSSPEIYEASLLFFQNIIFDLLIKSKAPSFSEFRWMNDLNETSIAFLQVLSDTIQVPITMLVLDEKSFQQNKVYPSTRTENAPIELISPTKRQNKTHITIFYEKRSETTFTLYQSFNSQNSPKALSNSNSNSKKPSHPSPQSRRFSINPIPLSQNYTSAEKKLIHLQSLETQERLQYPQEFPSSISNDDFKEKPKSLHDIIDAEPETIENLTKEKPLSVHGRSRAFTQPSNPGEGHFDFDINRLLNREKNDFSDPLQNNTMNYDFLQSLKRTNEELLQKPIGFYQGATYQHIISGDSKSSPKSQEQTQLEIVKPPSYLKQKFETWNKEIQSHEHEFSQISMVHTTKELPKEHEKENSGKISSLHKKYQEIVSRKMGQSALSMQPGMRMDS